MTITQDILIEDLVAKYPSSVKFLREKKIRCLACGEPIWGTLADSAHEKGLDDSQIDLIVKELNDFIENARKKRNDK